MSSLVFHGTHREYRASLIAAVKVIRQLRCGRPMRAEFRTEIAWRIYWRTAPEMAPIREALAGVDLDEPEKL